MEKMLHRLARQLDSLDEASLMALWSKYATLASRFEPTRRWEDACLVFSLIQAKRWKNQLFNYLWSQQLQPSGKKQMDLGMDFLGADFNLEAFPQSAPAVEAARGCRVLNFRPLDESGPNGDSQQEGTAKKE